MNCILLHGMSFYLEQGFGSGVIERAKKLGLNIIIPHFTLEKDITFDNWEKTALKYKQYFSDSIVICHSLSTLFILKFFNKHNLKCRGLITVAGGYTNEIVIPSYLYLKKFIPSIDDFEYVKNAINSRYSFYSNEDHIFSDKQLQDYISMLASKPVFLKNRGHFGLRTGIKDIPEIEEVLIEIISNNT